MFDSIRDKLYSLQENLTTSIRSLSVGDPINRRPVIKQYTLLNLSAGADILDKFQTSWSELNEASQKNATKAQEVDRVICKLHESTEKKMKDISHLTAILTSLPEVVNSLNDLGNKIVSLESLFDNVEEALIQLEDIIDTREFQSRQLEHRFQLALHNEKKLQKLENMRINLAEELEEKMKMHEIRQQRLLKEYQKVSEENFKEDLKIYKETNTIPKIEFVKSKNSNTDESTGEALEDIILDNEDSEVLDQFLNDSNSTSTK